jgi:8-oxo-dGTP pyrophosphatase MutT (NUDIX family)
MDADIAGAHSDCAAFRNWCKQAVRRLVANHPSDASRLHDLQLLLEMDVDLRSRRTLPGHLTASVLVLSPDRRSILLIHNRGLGRWLQPGGHLEAGEFPLEAARREVAEEVGLDRLEYLATFADDPSLPLDIDSHPIPASAAKSESAHMHHDFLYAMVVPTNHPAILNPQPSEISAAEWVSLTGSQSDPLPRSLRRAVDRLFKPRN